MFSSLLVPIDFSDDSARGAQLADKIARRHGARLTALYVDAALSPSRRPGSRSSSHPPPPRLGPDPEQQLRAFLAPLTLSTPVDVALAHGQPGRAIDTFANQIGADLIVLAPHDKGIDAPLTSLSTWVAAETACPVLIHRSRIGTRASPVAGFQRPLIAISDQELAPLALSVATGLAERGAHFELMHVLENAEVDLLGPPGTTFHEALRHSSEEVEEQLKALGQGLEQGGFAVSVRVDTGDPVQSVLCRVETTPNDLVVLSRTNSPGGQGQLSDHAYAMVQKSPVPVLIVPRSARALRARPLPADLVRTLPAPRRRASS